MAQLVDIDLFALTQPLPPQLPALPLPGPKAWPAQGDWTYDDYLRLPDNGRRYEIIEGVLYVTNAPGFDHQYAVQKLAFALETWVRSQQGGVVLTAPFEVHLGPRSRPVQPDVLYLAPEHRPRRGARFFDGTPNLVVEVLSPSTLRTDRVAKFLAYERAGVREYWIVDPTNRSVEIFVRNDAGQYDLQGQYGSEEIAASVVLAGFTLAVAELFA